MSHAGRKHKGFPSGSDGKESACSAGDLGLVYKKTQSEMNYSIAEIKTQ